MKNFVELKALFNLGGKVIRLVRATADLGYPKLWWELIMLKNSRIRWRVASKHDFRNVYGISKDKRDDQLNAEQRWCLKLQLSHRYIPL